MPALRNEATGKDVADEGGKSVTVGTSSATLAAANVDRVGIYISNTHATNYLTVAFEATAVAGEGIYLAPGAVLYDDTYTGIITGIASGASTGVGVVEI